jgi:hypothetical protein
MFDAIRTFFRLLNRAKWWVVFYLFFGCLFIYIGNALYQYKVLSTTLTSIGGSFLAIGLVTVIVEVSTSWHVLQILHMYGDYKEHGIYRVFPDADREDYRELYRRATAGPQAVRVLALMGRKFTENDDKIATAYKLAKDSHECRFLFIEINSHGYKYRYDHMEPLEDGDIVGLINADIFKKNYEKLRSMIASLHSPSKEAKSYQAVPVFNLEFYDDLLFVSFYGYRSRSKNRSPILVFEKRDNSSVYKYFAKQFEEYWGLDNKEA